MGEKIDSILNKTRYYYFFYLFFFFRYFSIKKLINILISAKDYFLKKEIVSGKPFIASIDPTNFCILHCPLCPTGRREKGTITKTLTFMDFKKYFDQIKDYLFFIRLYNWGEPFLAKDLFQMIDYAHQNRVGVVINSNLNYCPKNIIKKIVQSQLDYLMVSIDGTTQTTYEKYRRGGNLATVINNAKQIAGFKKMAKTNLPILHWSYLVNKYNFPQQGQARKLAQKIGFNLITFLPLSLITKVNEEFSPKQKLNWLGDKLPSQKGENGPGKICYFLWSSVNISPNGLVFPCCGIYEDKYAFGDLKRQSFGEIWNNHQFRFSRRLFGTKDQIKNQTICQVCTWFKKND